MKDALRDRTNLLECWWLLGSIPSTLWTGTLGMRLPLQQLLKFQLVVKSTTKNIELYCDSRQQLTIIQ